MICETASCVWVGGCVESRAGWHGSKLVTKHHQHFRLHTLPAVMDFNGLANQYTHPQIKITFLLKKKKTPKGGFSGWNWLWKGTDIPFGASERTCQLVITGLEPVSSLVLCDAFFLFLKAVPF